MIQPLDKMKVLFALLLIGGCMEPEVLKLVRTEVKAIRVELPCEEDGCSGKLETCEGMVLTSYPALYPHRCTKCGVERHISGITYPYIEYK